MAGGLLVETNTLCCALKYCKCCLGRSPSVVSITQRHKPRFPAILLTRHLLGGMHSRTSILRRLRRSRSKTKLREGLRILVNMCGLWNLRRPHYLSNRSCMWRLRSHCVRWIGCSRLRCFFHQLRKQLAIPRSQATADFLYYAP